MSSAVAPAIVASEAAHSPSTASSRIGSNGSSMLAGRAGAAVGGSWTSWMGVLIVRAGTSVRLRLAGDERLLLVEPLRQHHAGDGRGGLGAEAAVLDGHGQNDGFAAVGHVTHVPRLVAVARALGGAGLPVDGEGLLVPAEEDVRGRAVADRRLVQALHDGRPGARIHPHAP